MNRSTLTIVLYLFLVFTSGVAVGGFGYHLYTGTPVSAARQGDKPKLSPEEWRRQYLNEMQTRVHLTEAQIQEMNGILDSTRSLFHEARQKHNQELKALREDQADRIRAILTPEQRPEYEKLRAERDQRSKATKK
jgi:Spy/CpxP family protein refolding chaperone